MLTYVLIYIFSFLFAICYSKSRDKYASLVFKVVTFLLLCLPACLRYKIGTDYASYIRIINRCFRSGHYDVFEAGWIPILWLIKSLKLDTHFFFIIVSTFTYFIVFKYIERPYFYLCIPVYVCTAYLESYNLVRQSFACTVFFLCIMAFQKEKYFRAIFWGVLSFLFHKSTIVLCLLLPLSAMKCTMFSPYKNAFFFLLIYIFFTFINVGEILMEKVAAYTPYAAYVTASEYNRQTEMRTGLGILLRVFILFIFIFMSSRKQDKKRIIYGRDRILTEELCHEKNYKISCIFVFALLMFSLLGAQIRILGRLVNLLSPFYLLEIQTLAKSESKYKRVCLFVIILIFFALFVATLTSSPSSAKRGLGLVPYQSIFSR